MTKKLSQQDELKQLVMNDPEARLEYEAFKLQLALADQMKRLRERVKLSQEEVADKMNTTKSTIARLEAAGGKNKHSPSLSTLVKYADALGYRLEVSMKRLPVN